MVDIFNNITLLILLFFIFNAKGDIINNPIQINNDLEINDFIINFSTSSVRADSKNLVISKDLNEIEYLDNLYYLSPDFILCKDQSSHYFLFSDNNYYNINPDNSKNLLGTLSFSEQLSSEVHYLGFITENYYPDNGVSYGTNANIICTITKNEIIIYGKKGSSIYFYYIKEQKSYEVPIANIGDKISCKFIRGSRYVCAYFIETKIQIIILAHIYVEKDIK